MEQQERSVRVIFLRHAIARHNVMNDRSQPPTTDPSWLDPSLTLPGKLHAIAAGHVIRSWLMENDNASKRRQGSLEKETSPQQHQQQQHLRHPPPLLSGQPFESNNNNRDTHQNLLVVTSPLTRCLQTASLAFLSEDCGAPVESQNNVATAGKDDAARPSTAHTGRTAVAAPATPAPTVICCKEDVREAFGIHYPYQRRAKSILQAHWPAVQFDTTMSELDNCWKKDSRESWDDVGHRVTAFLAWLAATVAVPGCLYDAIVVVSHGVWIEALLHLYSPAAASAAAATPTNDPQPQRQQQQRHRVYNTDAYGCECVVSTADQRFLRLQDVRLICSHEQVSNLCKEAAFAA